jgi:hypothetical protein
MSDIPLGKLAEMRSRGVLPSGRQTLKRSVPDDQPTKKKSASHKKRKSGEPAILSTKVPISRKRIGE